MKEGLDIRSRVIALVDIGFTQASTSRLLGKSRERVSQLCKGVYGVGAAMEHFRLANREGEKILLKFLVYMLGRKRVEPMLWVMKEAVHRGMKVGILINPQRDYNFLIINNWRVDVLASGLFKLNGRPFFHWPITKKEADFYALLGIREGFVCRAVILPASEVYAGQTVYLPLEKSRHLPLYENKYPFAYVDRWGLLKKKHRDMKTALRRAA